VVQQSAADATTSDDELMDESAAECDLQAYLEDDAYSLYSTLVDEHSYDDLKFSVRRNQISELLNRERVDGAEVFMALFPSVTETPECVA
jgi:hypothetical protein